MQIPTLRLQICQTINLLPEMIKRSQYIIFSVFVLINTIHTHVHIVVHGYMLHALPLLHFCSRPTGRLLFFNCNMIVKSLTLYY